MRRVICVMILAITAVGCASKSPGQEGEEYGATIKHGDPLVSCVMESVKRYEDKDKERKEFYDACHERATR